MGDMDPAFVTVATYDNDMEAGYYQAMVEAEGIPVVVSDREVVAVEWQIHGAVGDIKLQVPLAEAERAREILKARSRRSSEEEGSLRALRIAFLGLMLPPIQLYALWLVARLVPRWRELSLVDRRRVIIASATCLWLPVFVFALTAM